jgi:hypothetical protein
MMHYLGLKSNNSCTKSNEAYVLQLKDKCDNIIRLENYINGLIPIKHKCLNCNAIYKIAPKIKLMSSGCKFCRIKNKPGILYLVYFESLNLFKIGITTTTVKERLRSIEYSYTTILELNYNSISEAHNMEKQWLSNIEYLKVNTNLLKSGNTETFKFEVL